MKHASVFTVFYCTSIVLMLVLLHGCASTTHTQTTPAVPMMTTETHTTVEQRVKNPETGDYEMKVVSEEHTKTQSSMTETETHTIVKQRVKNPETGNYEMKVVSKEHTKTQSSILPKK